MTELEKQIVELREIASIELKPRNYEFSGWEMVDEYRGITARRGIKIIESLQAEKQELKLHAAGVYLNDQIKIGNLEAENQELQSKLEEAKECLKIFMNGSDDFSAISDTLLRAKTMLRHKELSKQSLKEIQNLLKGNDESLVDALFEMRKEEVDKMEKIDGESNDR